MIIRLIVVHHRHHYDHASGWNVAVSTSLFCCEWSWACLRAEVNQSLYGCWSASWICSH